MLIDNQELCLYDARMAAPSWRALILIAFMAGALAACGGESDSSPPEPSAADPSQTEGQVLGFVFSRFRLTMAPPNETACPEGFNLNAKQLGEKLGTEPPNDCENPTAHAAPEFFTLDSPGVILGMDLDATTSSRAAGGACAHDDFEGPGGESGIDNQVWRVVGCVRGFQQGDLIDSTSGAAVKDGSRTILMEVSGVDDLRNDTDVVVRLYSSTDPAPKDAAGEILGGGSLFVHENPRFHSPPAPGSIVDGILITEPIDLHLQVKVQTIDSEYYFRSSRLRLELLPDGRARGLFAGYQDVANFYDINGGHRLARSASHFLGFTCPGLYAAAQRMADGHPDPETGACTSLSTALEVEALPAFVIHPEAVASGEAT